MNLHYFITFSSRGSGVCRSLFLRTFMVMMLFITGSNGLYAGEDLKAMLPPSTTSFGSGVWDGTNKYSWTANGINDLMPIFTNLKGKLNTNYVALKFTTRNYVKDQRYRVCFMKDGDTTPIAEILFYMEGDKDLPFATRNELKDKDLSQVDKILFGGHSTSGSITLDPNSIVLIGQSHVEVSANDATKGAVYFTVGNDATQYTNKTVPNHTSVKFYANPNTEKHVVFTGWGGDGEGKYWNNPTEVEVTGNLNFIAKFADGIHIKCTVDPQDAAEPDVYQKGHPDWKLPDNGYVAPGQATTFAFKNQQKKYKFLGWYDAKNNNLLSTETLYTVDNINVETKVIAKFSTSEINEECTIKVDEKVRRYWLYVPASLEGKKDVPVVFSLHGRYNNDNPNEGGKPVFTSLAKEKGFIVVYPQGRDAKSDQDKADYPGDWYYAFGGGTGWEATGKENADTKFIKALVDKIQSDYKEQTASNSNISVDPKKFYLCGFSMGGMMTYACAKVLNGTFAAYGSCGGFPLNEFHMNLATENPIPFIHMHGNKDQLLGIKHLNTIIENLLFRNGCDLSNQVINKEWAMTTENGETHKFKRYDFTSVNGAPVTTVTFDELQHNVEASAPAYLWDFFKDKTVGEYDSNIEWKWDMPTINDAIAKSQGDNVNAYTYGWKHEIKGTDRSLTYGGGGKTQCSSEKCTSANDDCNGNHNVYNSIQLTAGKHTLYAKTQIKTGWASVTLQNNLTGAEIVARKIVNNTGQADALMTMLYEFEVGEDAEYSLILKRENTESKCTSLEIRRGAYRPEGESDQSQDNATINIEEGKLAELTFENVDINPIISGYGAALPSDNGNMKLYLKSRLGIQNGTIDKKAKYIVQDAVFGHYFQNIPDADIYDRYGASDYMRVVLGPNNSLSGHDGIAGIQTTGAVTIGFWVNGNLAVNRGLAYDEPSMFYIAGETYNGPNREDNPHMFNITCSGGLSGYMNNGAFKYNSGRGSFGGLCDTKSNADFYNKNFYKDCNWHYITYQMYDNLSRFNMYVDGEPTCLGGYATHNAGSLEEYINGLKSIVLGGANANNVEFGYDVAFAYDDIVIYNRVLSKREINEIIKKKNYSPSVWHFDRNLENNIFCNRDLLNTTMWPSSSDGVYTLNSDFTQAAALTYDGITEIPAFKGLRFVTNGTQKIQIDAKNGALHLSQGVKVMFSNLAKDTYVRMEYKNQNHDNVNWTVKDLFIPGNTPSPSQGCVRTLFKVTSGEPSITMPSDINIIRMESTLR